MGDVWPVPGGGGAASLLGTSPEQRKRSMPSSTREAEASGWLRFPPLWETSGLSLVAVGLDLSWGRLRSRENGTYRRGLAKLKTSAGLRFPSLWETSVGCMMLYVLCCAVLSPIVLRLCCVVLRCVEVCCVVCGVLCVFLPSVRAGGVLFKTRTNHLEWLE